MVTYTSEQILVSVPDASSAQSVKALAKPRKWLSSGREKRSVWVEC